MEKPVVIFGASVGGQKVAKTLHSFGIDIEYFVDNNQKVWGTIIDDKPVKSPMALIEDDNRIIIASIYQEEIEEQLLQMGIDEKRFCLKEQFVMEYIHKNLSEYDYLVKEHLITHDKRTYVLDIAEGMEIGGIESWSYNVAEALLYNQQKVVLLSKQTEAKPPKGLNNNVIMVDITYEEYKESLHCVIASLKNMLPFTMMASWMTQNYFAAYILQKYFPDQVVIIGVVHHDMVSYYKRNQFLDPYINAFLCVSNDTRKTMIEQYHIEESKVFYKEVPIKYSKSYKKAYSEEKHPIQINFGARLVKPKKRSDLLIPLIELLEDKNVLYHMNIAGEGNYYHIINEYILNHKLEEKITLYGGLKYEQMSDFWKTGDIVISISDSEGMGLSILEAMAFGLVPVVTNTAGIGKFVINGQNGFVCNINDVLEIADKINFLDKNRNILKEYGERAKQTIIDQCSSESYVKHIYDIERQ